MGWCGLKYLEEMNETDLGYRLKENTGTGDMQPKHRWYAWIMDSIHYNYIRSLGA